MIPKRKYSVIIVAGGKGLRAGGEIPKQFQAIGGMPVLMRTVKAFHDFDSRMRVVIALSPEFISYWEELCRAHSFDIPHEVVAGGETRFHSVKNALAIISDNEIVGIHDAARPFVTPDLIERCYQEASDFDCGIVPVIDEPNSVRLMEGYQSKVINRSLVKIVQTPQVFPAQLIKNAYQLPYKNEFTDDASVAEEDGIQIRLVPGNLTNMKITSPLDLDFARFLCEKSNQ